MLQKGYSYDDAQCCGSCWHQRSKKRRLQRRVYRSKVCWRVGASQPSRSAGMIFILSVCRLTVIFNVILNTHQRHSRTPCLVHAQIYIASILRVGCTTAGALLVVVGLHIHKNNLYCNHQLLAQLLHHFLPYISWIAPARQQCSTFC